MISRRPRLVLGIIAFWLLFVVSLSAWWMVFSLKKIEQLVHYLPNDELLKEQRMLMMEGGVLIFALLLGGFALLYFARQEQKRFEQIKLFFATFSHDFKTSIMRLLLVGEEILDQNPKDVAFLRLHKNLLHLQLQLENSLSFAQENNPRLHIEKLSIEDFVEVLSLAWSDVKIHFEGQKNILADKHVLMSILKNLISNSILHSQKQDQKHTHQVFIKVKDVSPWTQLEYWDEGLCQNIDLKSLGLLKQTSKKSTGLGLFLVKRWMESHSGRVSFNLTESGGLKVCCWFPNERTP